MRPGTPCDEGWFRRLFAIVEAAYIDGAVRTICVLAGAENKRQPTEDRAMDSATYYILPSGDGQQWTIHHDGSDLAQLSDFEAARDMAVRMARKACEIGFAGSVISIAGKGDFEILFRCQPATSINDFMMSE